MADVIDGTARLPAETPPQTSSAPSPTPIQLVLIQGPKGDDGSIGADGAGGPAGPPGLDAFTTTTANFTQPISTGINVIVYVANGLWAGVGSPVYIPGAGYMVVVATSPLSITLQNYIPSIVSPGNVIPAGTTVSPAGLQGPQGDQGPSGGGGGGISYELGSVNGTGGGGGPGPGSITFADPSGLPGSADVDFADSPGDGTIWGVRTGPSTSPTNTVHVVCGGSGQGEIPDQNGVFSQTVVLTQPNVTYIWVYDNSQVKFRLVSTSVPLVVIFAPDGFSRNQSIMTTRVLAEPVALSSVGITSFGSNSDGSGQGVQGIYSTCSGGDKNSTLGDRDVIAGGESNATSLGGDHNTVGGGELNSAGFSTTTHATTVGGYNCQASGNYSVAGGFGASATGDQAVCFGGQALETGGISLGSNEVQGQFAFAAGTNNGAVGNGSVAIGSENQAIGDSSVATGNSAHSKLNSEHARSNGALLPGVDPYINASDIVVAGSSANSPGPSGGGEIIEIDTAFTPFNLLPGRAASLELKVIVTTKIAGVNVSQSYFQKFCLHADSNTGNMVIVAESAVEQFGSPALSAWTLGTVTSGQNFATNITTDATVTDCGINVVGNYSWVEVGSST